VLDYFQPSLLDLILCHGILSVGDLFPIAPCGQKAGADFIRTFEIAP
jgi:hypothetical protein